MTDLELAEAQPAPRPDDTTEALALHMTPRSSFVIRGILTMSLSCTAALIAGAVSLGAFAAATKTRPLPPVFGIITGVVALAALGVAWLPFTRHVKRKRAAAHKLARHGVLATATTGDVTTITRANRGGRVYTSFFSLAFTADGAQQGFRTVIRRARQGVAASYPVLYHEGNCAAFMDGHARPITLN